MLHGSGTWRSWPVRKENDVAHQRAEIRMIRWMCDINVKDIVPRETENRIRLYII